MQMSPSYGRKSNVLDTELWLRNFIYALYVLFSLLSWSQNVFTHPYLDPHQSSSCLYPISSLIFTSHQRLGFSSGLLPTKAPFAPFHSPYASQASPIQMFFIWSPEFLLKLKTLMQSLPVTSHLVQNVFLSTLFSDTLILCSSIRVLLSQWFWFVASIPALSSIQNVYAAQPVVLHLSTEEALFSIFVVDTIFSEWSFSWFSSTSSHHFHGTAFD